MNIKKMVMLVWFAVLYTAVGAFLGWLIGGFLGFCFFHKDPPPHWTPEELFALVFAGAKHCSDRGAVIGSVIGCLISLIKIGAAKD